MKLRLFIHSSISPIAEPLPLMDLCRRTIRQQVGKANIERGRVEELNVPKAIRDYLQFKDRR